MEKIVELKNVSKTYKIGDNDFKALDDVNLSINKGEMVVVLGPSGAGKSTLLNLIGGMDTPTSGITNTYRAWKCWVNKGCY